MGQEPRYTVGSGNIEADLGIHEHLVAVDRKRFERLWNLARAAYDRCPVCFEECWAAMQPGDWDELT